MNAANYTIVDAALDPVFLEALASAIERNLPKWRRDSLQQSAWRRNAENLRLKAANERRALSVLAEAS